MANFKFGAKLKLFGEHDLTIKPNPEYPGRVEYHDEAGISVTRAKLVEKLNITSENVQSMIPETTRVTDLIFDRNTNEFEIGVVIEPGEDFVLNRYKDIIVVDEVSLFYRYDPAATAGEGTDELPAADDVEDAVDDAMDDFADEDPMADDGPMDDEGMDDEDPMEE